MKASKHCIDIIRDFEGFRSRVYLCPAGIPTIGYGSTRYPDGRRVTQLDPPITEEQAADLLRATLAPYEEAVTQHVTVPMNQNEFDALVSFTYNVGPSALQQSTLLRKLNRGDRAGAANEFRRWSTAGGKVLPGLVKRRELERGLFLGQADVV